MWKSRVITPSFRTNVIYVTDRDGSIYSFPIVRNKLSLRLLRLTFYGASGLYYSDGAHMRYWDPSQEEEYHDIKLVNGIFKTPPGGWFERGRTYYVHITDTRKRDVLAVEMLKRYQAIKKGVTVYFEQDKAEDRIKIVAAIDFGTSFSGYAYSYGDNPKKIFTNTWKGKGMSESTEKAPTTVLLNPEGKYHSFGYEAEDEYSLLVDGEVFYDWSYFRNFKMKLYQTKDLRRDTMIRDVDGKPRRALDIFTMAIKRLKKQLLRDVQARSSNIKLRDIDWVITVPAIWSDAAKQFMREATENAGIDGNCLKLVLEPEAASLYCKTLDVKDIEVISGEMEGNPFVPGKQYVLLDLGGGTADMSAHEILGDGSLREIHKATGDALGGSTIDEAFGKLIGEIVGPEVMLDFFRDYRQDYVKFMRDFESKKRLPTDLTSSLVFELPTSLTEVLRHRSHTTIEEAIQNCGRAAGIKVKGDKLMLNGEMIQDLFQPTMDGIVSYIQDMKTDARLKDTQTIVLAGGFSKCIHVRSAIKAHFPKALIVSSSEAGLAILKGAVLMGHKPETIVERVARYTYGVNFARKPFYEGEDPPELKATRDGEVYCDDVFEKLVEVGQPIRYSDVFTVQRKSKMTSKQAKMKNIYTKIFASLDNDPEYCTEEYYCVKIGEIIRTPPKGGWPDEVKTKIEIMFGETEMVVRIAEETTGLQYRARIDSL